MRRTLPTALALTALLGASSALAQPASARRRFETAMAAFDAQDYPRALTLFQDLYTDTRSPEILFNLGATLEAMHRDADAARAFRRFLQLAPESTSAELRARTEARVARLEAPPEVVPPPAPSPEPIAPRVAPPAPRHGNALAWALVGGGGGVAALGMVLLGAAHGVAGGASSEPNEAGWASTVSTAEGMQVGAWVTFSIGIAAAVTGGVLLWRGSARRTTVGVAPTRGGAAASFGVAF